MEIINPSGGVRDNLILMILKWLPEWAALGFSVRCPSVNHDFDIVLNNNRFHEPLYKQHTI